MCSGVPQGSILSSLLCPEYIDDLPSQCKTALPLLCTDDAKFNAVNDKKTSIRLSRMKQWSDYFDLNTQETVKFLSTRSDRRMDFDEVNQTF